MKKEVRWTDSAGEHVEEVHIKELTLLESAAVDEFLYKYGYMEIADPKTGEKSTIPNRTAQAHQNAELISACIVNEEGNRVYTHEQALNLPVHQANALRAAIMPPTVEEAAKNSTATTGVASS